jgi:hypothetical protein
LQVKELSPQLKRLKLGPERLYSESFIRKCRFAEQNEKVHLFFCGKEYTATLLASHFWSSRTLTTWEVNLWREPDVVPLYSKLPGCSRKIIREHFEE